MQPVFHHNWLVLDRSPLCVFRHQILSLRYLNRLTRDSLAIEKVVKIYCYLSFHLNQYLGLEAMRFALNQVVHALQPVLVQCELHLVAELINDLESGQEL